MDLNNCVVLIPGANRPIGRAIAQKFAETGARLVVPYFSDWQESTNEMIEEFTASGYNFFCQPCDLTRVNETAQLISAVDSHFGELHFLINNIERGGMPIVHGSYDLEQNQEQWDLELQTTLKAKWNLYHHALPLMRKSGQGAVTNISSIAAITGRSGPTSLLFNDGYSAANRGVATFTETWSREAAPKIRVNEVMLGLIQGRHAENTKGWALLSRQQQQDILDHTLLERTGTPEEIADIVFFLTAEAHYVTGCTIRADGGYCLGGERVLSMPSGIL